MLSLFSLSLSPSLALSPSVSGSLARGPSLCCRAAVVMQAAAGEVADEEYTTTASGLKYLDVVSGNGEVAEKGAVVQVDYTGTLASDGTQFDSSKGRSPLAFELGAGRVIPGWDEGIAGMKVGGKRTLVVPASLAYGETGAGASIPPDSDLVFETELVGIATGVDALASKIPGGLPNLILSSVLLLSFIPYFLPEDVRPDLWK